MPDKLSQLLGQYPGSSKASLDAWLAYRDISKKWLAEKLGVHPSMITRIAQGKRAPKKRISQLIELGVPADLLPEPSKPPGRPLGSKTVKK